MFQCGDGMVGMPVHVVGGRAEKAIAFASNAKELGR